MKSFYCYQPEGRLLQVLGTKSKQFFIIVKHLGYFVGDYSPSAYYKETETKPRNNILM